MSPWLSALGLSGRHRLSALTKRSGRHRAPATNGGNGGNGHHALAGLAAVAAIVIGLTAGTQSADAPTSEVAADVLPGLEEGVSTEGAVSEEAVPAMPAPVEARIASYVGALQPNGWYCGPAATRIALTAQGVMWGFDDIAANLGTTRDGTSSIFEVTRVLNEVFGYERYSSVEMPGRTVSPEQVQRLRDDVVRAVNDGDVVVANTKGTITDLAGEVHSFPGGHYVSITGYFADGAYVTVTDPADRVGGNEYNVPVEAMAYWIATRGYSA